MAQITAPVKPIKPVFRSLVFATLACLAPAETAHAQFSYTFYPNNATINSDVTTDFAIAGYAGGSYNGDFTRNFTGAASPAVNIVDGANIVGEVDSFNSSTVNITGGSVTGVVPFDTSLVNISGSASVGYILGLENSVISMTGGYVSDLEGQGKSISVSGGLIDTLVANVDTDAFGNTIGSCIVDVTGGHVGGMQSYNLGILNIRGGTLGAEILAAFGGTVNIYGNGLNATLVDPNFFFNGGVSAYHYYTLSGSLQDGTVLSNTPIYVRNDSPGDGPGISSLHLFSGTAAPEPGVASLLLLGGAGPAAAWWRRRRRGSVSCV